MKTYYFLIKNFPTLNSFVKVSDRKQCSNSFQMNALQRKFPLCILSENKKTILRKPLQYKSHYTIIISFYFSFVLIIYFK